jgi:hypothetical protein
MGLLSDIGGFFTGDDPELVTPFLGKAPDFPNLEEANQFLQRQQYIARNPLKSHEYRTGSAAIRDSGAVGRRGVLEAIDESFGGPDGPGVKSGAAGKAKVAGSLQVSQGIVSNEREFLNQLLERADRSVLALLDMMGRYRASTFASEAQTAVKPGTGGLFDFVSEGTGVIGGFTGVGGPGGNMVGGIFGG